MSTPVSSRGSPVYTVTPPSTPNSLNFQGQQLIETIENPHMLFEELTRLVTASNCGTREDMNDVVYDWNGNAYDKKTMFENWGDFLKQQ